MAASPGIPEMKTNQLFGPYSSETTRIGLTGINKIVGKHGVEATELSLHSGNEAVERRGNRSEGTDGGEGGGG